MKGGEMITKPITFKGGKLTMNFSSSVAGGVQVEIQDAEGKAIPGFSLEDAEPQFGDSIQRSAVWKNSTDVSTLAGKPVRLRFVLNDADLYSIKFE